MKEASASRSSGDPNLNTGVPNSNTRDPNPTGGAKSETPSRIGEHRGTGSGTRRASNRFPIAEQARLLTAYATHVVPENSLESLLEEAAGSGRPLRVKLGVDPTARHVHLGWAVVLRRLRLFQDFGHTAVLIIGDFTARVGDPSGRSKTRPRLSKEQVDEYADACLSKILQILTPENLEIRRNSEWLEKFDAERFLWLTSQATVARMLERDDFSQRYAAGNPISLVEFIYPLLQAYDSVAVEADVELGGNDQIFNLVAGRDLQRAVGQRPQVCITMPLLRGTDGKLKMSQSYGNYIAIDEKPIEMFGKLMSIPDELLPEYIRLAAGFSVDEAEKTVQALASGELSPRDAKRKMAESTVALYHGADAARRAVAEFDRVFVRHDLPSHVPEAEISASDSVDGRVWVARLLALAGLAASNSEGRRLISQRAVRIDGVEYLDPNGELPLAELDGKVIQVGKRRFARIRVRS